MYVCMYYQNYAERAGAQAPGARQHVVVLQVDIYLLVLSYIVLPYIL